MSYLKERLKLLLKEQGLSPSKGLGQNFLINPAVIGRMSNAIGANNTDIIVEVGPGLGFLTRLLTDSAKKVIAVEKDSNMVKILKKEYGSLKNLEIINSDILKWEPIEKDYILAGNIPFYLTAPVIRKFLEADNPPQKIVFIIQKEVAQRICAKPPKMSILAVSVQLYAKTKIISHIEKDSFWPKPKIDSAIIEIIPQKKTDSPVNLFEVVKAGFSQPRKQLLNNLSKQLKTERLIIEKKLIEIGINPNQRAETLSVQDWINLAKRIKIT